MDWLSSSSSSEEGSSYLVQLLVIFLLAYLGSTSSSWQKENYARAWICIWERKLRSYLSFNCHISFVSFCYQLVRIFSNSFKIGSNRGWFRLCLGCCFIGFGLRLAQLVIFWNICAFRRISFTADHPIILFQYLFCLVNSQWISNHFMMVIRSLLPRCMVKQNCEDMVKKIGDPRFRGSFRFDYKFKM